MSVAIAAFSAARSPVSAQSFPPSTTASAFLVAEKYQLPSGIRDADSAGTNRRRSMIIGAVVGGIAGGLAAAGYVLNATAYHCVTVGPPCPNNHTSRRVVTITAGTATGAALGAWIGHKISVWRR